MVRHNMLRLDIPSREDDVETECPSDLVSLSDDTSRMTVSSLLSELSLEAVSVSESMVVVSLALEFFLNGRKVGTVVFRKSE